MTRLPENLDKALRVIANNEMVSIEFEDIKKLLLISYISDNIKEVGW